MSLREFGPRCNHVIEARYRLLVAADNAERRRAIEAVLDQIRGQRQRPIVAFDRLDIAPERAQYIGAVAMRLGQIGCDRNSAIETRQRFLVLPERA
ncbi:MAG: hypothetical protein WBD33_09715 [Xanthobacteraceae bacterium]